MLDRWERGEPVNITTSPAVLPERLEAIDGYSKTLVQMPTADGQRLTGFRHEA